MQIPGRRINADEVVTTSPFTRGGDGLLLRAQLIDVSAAGGDCSVKVFTRNSESTWSTTAIGTMTIAGASGAGAMFELHLTPSSVATVGIKEELRLTVTGSGTVGGWWLIRVFPPLFYDSAIGTL